MAVERAKRALPGWSRLEPSRRAATLRRIADLLEQRLDELARLEARNVGKPIGDACGEIRMAVEHPIPPRSLCAPLHRHAGVDEYSFVLEGRLGALLGEEVVYAEVGELALKLRDQWHTFWNAGDEPCRVLEVISPGGFEHFFREFDESTKDGSFDPVALSDKYGIEFDMESVPRLCAEHGLVHPLVA